MKKWFCVANWYRKWCTQKTHLKLWFFFLSRLVKTGKPYKQKHSHAEFAFNSSDCEQLSIDFSPSLIHITSKSKNKTTTQTPIEQTPPFYHHFTTIQRTEVCIFFKPFPIPLRSGRCSGPVASVRSLPQFAVSSVNLVSARRLWRVSLAAGTVSAAMDISTRLTPTHARCVALICGPTRITQAAFQSP